MRSAPIDAPPKEDGTKGIMAKRHPFKKAKPGEPIPATARQLESFMLEHNGRFNSRDYDKSERMELPKPQCRKLPKPASPKW